MESHLQVLTSNKDDATTAVARVIYQDIDPEMEVPDSGGLSSERRGSRCQIR